MILHALCIYNTEYFAQLTVNESAEVFYIGVKVCSSRGTLGVVAVLQ